MSFSLEPDDVGMLIACLKQEDGASFRDWCTLCIVDQGDVRRLAVTLAAIAAGYTRMFLDIPDDVTMAPVLEDMGVGRNEDDAMRLLIMHLNHDAHAAAGLLDGVAERGDLPEVVIHLTRLARGAVRGLVEGRVL